MHRLARFLGIRGGRSVKDGILVVIVKFCISVVVGVWISVPAAVRVLCILSCIDVFTAFFNSKRHLRDVLRRVALSILLALTVDYVYNVAKIETGLNVGFDIATMVCSFYILGEIIFILQNCAEAGVSLPPALLTLISKAEGLTGVERQELNALSIRQTREVTIISGPVAKKDDDLTPAP